MIWQHFQQAEKQEKTPECIVAGWINAVPSCCYTLDSWCHRFQRRVFSSKCKNIFVHNHSSQMTVFVTNPRPVCLTDCLTVCLPVSLSVYLSLWLSTCFSDCLSDRAVTCSSSSDSESSDCQDVTNLWSQCVLCMTDLNNITQVVL